MKSMREDILKIRRDMEIIKKMLMSKMEEDSEGELTDWAKEELDKARKTPESQYVSLENVKKRILKK